MILPIHACLSSQQSASEEERASTKKTGSTCRPWPVIEGVMHQAGQEPVVPVKSRNCSWATHFRSPVALSASFLSGSTAR